eukprot:876192-Amphidinium_carterae.1
MLQRPAQPSTPKRDVVATTTNGPSSWTSTPTRVRRAALKSHPSHTGQLYRVMHGDVEVGTLIACSRCGAYAQKRLSSLSTPCPEVAVLTAAKRQQLHRLGQLRHPNARAPPSVRLVLVGEWLEHQHLLIPGSTRAKPASTL